MKKVYTVKEITDILKPVFERNRVRKAILFGSYSKGCQNENSDIDLLVDSGLRGLAFYGLLEDVTEALDIAVDMIDITQVIPDSKVDLETKRTGVLIYES